MEDYSQETSRTRRRITEKLDGKHHYLRDTPGMKKFIKTRVVRLERHAAKKDPDTQPLYGKNRGFTT